MTREIEELETSANEQIFSKIFFKKNVQTAEQLTSSERNLDAFSAAATSSDSQAFLSCTTVKSGGR